MGEAPERRRSVAPDWLVALGWPLLGLAPGSAGPMDGRILLGFLVVTALPVALWWQRPGRPAGSPWAKALLGLAVGVLHLCLCLAFGPVPAPLGSARALLGLGPVAGALSAGLGLGRLLARRAPRWQASGTALGLALGMLLVALPTRAGLGGEVLARREPAWSAVLLSISPWSLTLEAAGFDWLRHPAVYGPAGTDWSSGYRRGPTPPLAAGYVLGMGVLLGLAATWLAGPRSD